MIDFDSAYVAKFYLNEPGQAAIPLGPIGMDAA